MLGVGTCTGVNRLRAMLLLLIEADWLFYSASMKTWVKIISRTITQYSPSQKGNFHSLKTVSRTPFTRMQKIWVACCGDVKIDVAPKSTTNFDGSNSHHVTWFAQWPIEYFISVIFENFCIFSTSLQFILVLYSHVHNAHILRVCLYFQSVLRFHSYCACVTCSVILKYLSQWCTLLPQI